MSETRARLVTWENGTDLVIELPLARDVEQVWSKLIDSETAGSWFAPFHLGEEPVGDRSGAVAESGGRSGAVAESGGRSGAVAESGDDESRDDAWARAIAFDLGETELRGTVLSCETCDHVLLELEDFGVLGIRLVPFDTTDAAGDATLLVFTQTAADEQSARLRAAEFGPMWDTHLRLFTRTLGLEIAEATEPELVETYSALELDVSGGDA